jgi:hypothetical protein
MGLPEERPSSKQLYKQRSAPAPGVPVSEEQYKRLKERAKHDPAQSTKHAQRDQSTEK